MEYHSITKVGLLFFQSVSQAKMANMKTQPLFITNVTQEVEENLLLHDAGSLMSMKKNTSNENRVRNSVTNFNLIHFPYIG